MPIQDGVDRADGRAAQGRALRAQFLANLRRAPGRVFPLQPDNEFLDRQRELMGVPVRPAAAIRQPLEATGPVAPE
jgi:hypothetical protein